MLIIEHQAVNFRLADMATQIDAARLMVARGNLKDAGRPCLTEASMAKMHASEMAEKVCSRRHPDPRRLRLHRRDPGRAHRPGDVRITQIYEGANDIQRLVIGRALAA